VLSARTAFDLRTNRLAQALARRQARSAPLLDLTESNPTRAGLLPRPEVLAALAHPAALRYEPDPRGRRSAREAVARDYARRGLAVEPERLVLTASTSEAYSFLFKLLCDPGDRVLVPRPGYPLFEFLGRLESVEVASYPLRYEGAWHIDLGALEEALDPRVRAVVVVNPHNPTGSYLKGEERARIDALCAQRGIAIVSDEVFADFALREVRDRAPSFALDGTALAFAMGGLSKSAGLPQLKLGWVAVSGPAAVRDLALGRLEVVADSFLSVATPIQVAAPGLLEGIEALQAPIRARLALNRALAAARVRGTAATLLDAEGGWYAVLQVPATIGEEERVLRLLEEQDVLVHPGYFFDFPQEAYLVASLLTDPDVFAKGIERIVGSLVL
jgi:aspartate/methionine/tyrosine aminotransferase